MKPYLLLLILALASSCTPKLNGLMVSEFTEEGIIIDSGKTLLIPGLNDPEATVFFFTRHAEKQKDVKDPGLTDAGIARANKLAKMLKMINIHGIYSTDYNRTKLTAKPTADDRKMEIEIYNPRKQADFIKGLKIKKGKHFLVVGHSNTTPAMLNLFQDKKVYPSIDESIYDNLFVVVINPNGKTEIFELKY